MFKCITKKTDRGFTLLECLFAIMLVGIAVTALVAANGSFTRINGAAAELSTAEYLIEQIKELTDMLAGTDPDFANMTFVASGDYDDVDDFQNRLFNPPITSDWQTLNEFSAYTQKIDVVRVSESNFEQVVYDDNAAFIRVTVSILLNGREISSASWIRARRY
jgi:prepilin-type N-terminal cleavage/methylation domain-containing protein